MKIKIPKGQDKNGLLVNNGKTFATSVQLHAGNITPKVAVKNYHIMKHFWHTNNDGSYWTGTLKSITTRQLKALCESTLKDLKKNSPQIF